MIKHGIYGLVIISNILYTMTPNENNFFADKGTYFVGSTVFSTSWLARAGNIYLGIGFSTPPPILNSDFEIKALNFDFRNDGALQTLPGEANQSHHQAPVIGVFSVDFVTHDRVSYLAIGGEGGLDDITTRVYLFDHLDKILVLKSSGNHGNSVNSVEWLSTPEALFLASGGEVGIGGFTTRVYKVDPSNPELDASLIASANHGDSVYNVSWLSYADTIFLATIGDPAGLPVVTTRIYKFDPVNETLTEFVAAATDHGVNDVMHVTWLVDHNNIYLTSAGGTTVRLFAFNRIDEPLNQVAVLDLSTDPEVAAVLTVVWVNIGGISYLAVGTVAPDATGRLYIYRFNKSNNPMFTRIESATRTHNGFVLDVDWLQYGAQTFLSLSGFILFEDDVSVRTYQVNFVEDTINALMRKKYYQNFLIYT